MNSINEQEKKWLLKEKYEGIETYEYEKECHMIDDGVPVAYLIGNIPFLGCAIDLSSKPLIPRPETEFWVDIFIKQVQQESSRRFNLREDSSEVQPPDMELGAGFGPAILDIFAGSGCIGVAAAKQLPQSRVDFAELHPQHIQQIQKNLSINQVVGNVFESDMFANVPPKQYDYILANPPYIADDRQDTVQDSVQENEDHTALYAPDDGLYFIKKLIKQAPNYLAPKGEVWIEFDPWQKELLEQELSKNTHFSHSFLEDQYKKARVLILQLQQYYL